MQLRLRDNLHWCECAGRIVFLDVAADRYFCLPRKANEAFLALASGAAELRHLEHLSVLADRGLLIESPSPEAFERPPAIEKATRDLLRGEVQRSGPVPLLRALAYELRAACQLRTRPFSHVIACAPRRCAAGGESRCSSQRAIHSIAAAADALAFLTRAHDRCLVRALGVHAACRSRHIRARLVIGVVAHPFSAHCWVQLGDEVVVGGYEQARLYTPILVVE